MTKADIFEKAVFEFGIDAALEYFATPKELHEDFKKEFEKIKLKNLGVGEDGTGYALLSDVNGLYISEDGIVILCEKRYDGEKRLAGRVVYFTEKYRSKFPDDIKIGTFSNKWDENAFKLLTK